MPEDRGGGRGIQNVFQNAHIINGWPYSQGGGHWTSKQYCRGALIVVYIFYLSLKHGFIINYQIISGNFFK